MTCDEIRGAGTPLGPDGNVFSRSWQLQVGAGTPASQVRLRKTVSAPQVLTDSDFSFTLEVSNQGSGAALGLVVVDEVPETLTVLSADGAGWNCSVIGNAVNRPSRSSLVQNS